MQPTQPIMPPTQDTQPILPSDDGKHPLEATKDDKKENIVSDVPPGAKASIVGVGDIPALPPTHHKIESIKTYNGWKIGDICYRKGEKCVIKANDFLTKPPKVTVGMFNEERRQINTEFHLISKTPPKVSVPPPPKPQISPNTMRNKAIEIHLCNPHIIRQLMAVNNIKYVGGGLKNLGNSCFMNATLQCLTYTQVFQNYIYQKIHTH